MEKLTTVEYIMQILKCSRTEAEETIKKIVDDALKKPLPLRARV